MQLVLEVGGGREGYYKICRVLQNNRPQLYNTDQAK